MHLEVRNKCLCAEKARLQGLYSIKYSTPELGAAQYRYTYMTPPSHLHCNLTLQPLQGPALFKPQPVDTVHGCLHPARDVVAAPYNDVGHKDAQDIYTQVGGTAHRGSRYDSSLEIMVQFAWLMIGR